MASSWFAADATVTIEMVQVGDPGNPIDPSDGDHFVPGTQNFGTVPYVYYISKYEITNAQYVEMLNAKGNQVALYNFKMGSHSLGGITQSGSKGNYTWAVKEGFANKPVNWVSFLQAASFVNWLTNGQGDGDTQTGVYDLTNLSDIQHNGVVRNEAAWQAGGAAIPTENEWYKAAYYDGSPSAPGDRYWFYATRSDIAPAGTTPNSFEANSANYMYGNEGGKLSDVGAYTLAISYFGTYDQTGNVYEWTDTIDERNPTTSRIMRRGAFNTNHGDWVASTQRDAYITTSSIDSLGFRIVSLQPLGGEAPSWAGYPVVNGYADTGDWLGVVEVTNAPWIYLFSLSAYIYIANEALGEAGGGWIFIPASD